MSRRFVKKPIEVEVFQYGVDPEPQWFTENKDIIKPLCAGESWILICTLEGDMEATKGDYIIKGIKNELYPCREDIFLETYEEVK